MPRTKTSARQALLRAATTLLADNPGASFIEVAEAAGVGRATLYRHFPTREDLLRELSLEAIRATDEAGARVMAEARSATDALRLVAEAMVPLGDRFCFLARLPELDDAEIKGHLRRQDAELSSLIQAAQQEGGLDPTLPAAWAVSVFNGLIYTAWQAVNDDGISAEVAAGLVFRTLMHGLSPSESAQ